MEEVAEMVQNGAENAQTTGNPALDELAAAAREKINPSEEREEKAEEAPIVEQEEKKQEEEKPVSQEVEKREIEKEESVEQKDTTFWYDQEEEAVEAKTKTVETKKTEDSKEDEDPDIALLKKYKKSGKSLKEFVNEYKVEDHSSWNDEKIVKEGLKKFLSLGDEEYEQAVYEYEQSGILQKKQFADQFRSRFDQENAEKLKQLESYSYQQDERAQQYAKKYEEELNSYANNIVGKDVFGLKVTDEMSNNLKNFINDDFTLQKEDGSFDMEKVFSVALWMKYGKDLVRANVTRAKNEGREQILKEVSNPSKNMTSSSRSAGSGLEAVQDAFNSLFK